MKSNNLFIIAKYGVNYIVYSVLAFFAFYIFGCEFLATISFFIALYFFYTFRNPERELQFFDNESVLAPCDGIVSSIEELDGEYRYKIEIESSVTDVAILRTPINGKVTVVDLYKGTKVSKNSKLFSALNEKLSVEFTDTNHGNSLKVVTTLKQSVVPIFSDLYLEQDVMKSLRYGYASNGVTTIYLKNNIRLNIHIGDRVRAAESLIAYFS